MKAGVTSILASLLPMVFVSPTARHSPKLRPGVLDPDRLSPRWEFQLDMLALDVFLFGLVPLALFTLRNKPYRYRYAVRAGDDNPMLRAGQDPAEALGQIDLNRQPNRPKDADALSDD